MKVSEVIEIIEARVVGLIHRTEARGCRVFSSVTQNISTATNTPLVFDTEVYDTDGCWDAGSPTRLTAQRDGYYLAGGAWTLAPAQNTAASQMHIYVRKNGSSYLGGCSLHTIANKDARIAVTTGMLWLSTGDYLEIVAYHDEGATKTASAAGSASQFLCNGWLMRIG